MGPPDIHTTPSRQTGNGAKKWLALLTSNRSCPMRSTLAVSYCILLLSCGCSVSHQKDHVRLDAGSGGFPSELVSVDAAVAEALRDRLSQTSALNHRLSKSKGTLFLDGVNSNVLNALSTELGKESWQLETRCMYFQDFKDVRSRRWARIIEIRVLSETPDSVVLRMTDGVGPLDGITFLIEMHQTGGKWKVMSRRVTSVS